MINRFIKKFLNKFVPFYYNFKKNNFTGSNHPIFIVSCNRSGSSILSSILRQHPSLRSINEKSIENKIIKKNGHTKGFSEDTIWKFLENPLSDHSLGKNEGFLWSHPKHLSEFYKENYFLVKALYYEIYREDSKKKPIINKPFSTIRIKLIKKIFPDAKIIFNIRSYKDFIKSNINKNLNDNRYKDLFKKERPDIGLHWYLNNSIALYHLNKFYKGQYFIFYHEKFYDENYNNQKIMEEVTDFLKIEKYNFSFHDVNKKYKFSEDLNKDYKILKEISSILEYENLEYEKLNKR